MMFSRGPVARAKIARVVGVDPIRDRRHAARSSQCIHLREKFVLAVVTPVGIVRDVPRIIELAGLDEFVAHRCRGNKVFHLLPVVSRKTGRKRRDGDGALAQRLLRRPRQIRRIRPTRKRHQHRRQRAQAREKRALFAQRRGAIQRPLRSRSSPTLRHDRKLFDGHFVSEYSRIPTTENPVKHLLSHSGYRAAKSCRSSSNAPAIR